MEGYCDMPKEKYEKPVRQHSFMSAADVAAGKPTTWNSIEITGLYCPEYILSQNITSV